CTLASALVKSKNRKAAMELGKLFSDKASEAKIKKMVFDRNGYRYHGIVKTFADTVRENNIQI
ncbi:MAG TPA: 50S ribosomal protein L18, partial [Spirochaetota bacterium]|nr:50S ribosomal protein L18 [Spirochaetota bacterium]